MLKQAFSDLSREAIHPTAEEIAASLDGAASAFAAGEVRAHLGWCDACRAIAGDYEQFQKPQPVGWRAEEDAAWRAMRSRLPIPAAAPLPRKPPLRWMPLAAAIAAAAAGPLLVWSLMRHQPPVIQERIVERTVTAPVQVAAVSLVDLRPDGSLERGSGERAATRVPASGMVTFLLYEAPADQVSARVLDSQGQAVWTGALQRQRGVYSLALGEELLRRRPLTIECGTVRYRIP